MLLYWEFTKDMVNSFLVILLWTYILLFAHKSRKCLPFSWIPTIEVHWLMTGSLVYILSLSTSAFLQIHRSQVIFLRSITIVHCVPKMDHQLMTITLWKPNRFSKFFHCWKESKLSSKSISNVCCRTTVESRSSNLRHVAHQVDV